MRSLMFVVASVVTLTLLGCQAQSGSVASDSNLKASSVMPLSFGQQELGKQALPLAHNGEVYWLVTSAREGLQLFDEQATKLNIFGGNFEVLSLRTAVMLNNHSTSLIAALDVETDFTHILAIDWQQSAFQKLAVLPGGEAQSETLCWYQDPQMNLSLFTVDTIGIVRQTLIVDGQQQQLAIKPVREFVGVPNATACAVDDHAGALYIAEEKVGVWHYPADPEAELERELIAATQPLGVIEGELKGLAVLADGRLLVSAPEQQGVWLLATDGKGESEFVSLAPAELPEALGVVERDGGVLLGAYDDSLDQYWQAFLPVELTTREDVSPSFKQIMPVAQTTPVEKFGDAADDPAIWINQAEPASSRILGTDKKQGLMAYDLLGNKLQQLNVGRVNNVDLRNDVTLNGHRIDLAAASNRTHNSISLFAIDPESGEMTALNDITTDLDDVYGLCMGRLGEQVHVYINATDGRFQHYLLDTTGKEIKASKVREFRVSSQPEGCVVDDENGLLYFGEEAAGVWQVSAAPSKALPRMIAPINETFVADVEGMGIYRLNGERYLVVSSQGNNSFAVFALDENTRYLGSFMIAMDTSLGIDGVSETDGLEVLSTPLGEQFPNGLMVVQDGRNNLPSGPQNFKLVDGSDLRAFIMNAK